MTQALNLANFANFLNSSGVAGTGGGGTGTNIASNDLTINGLTVGKGAGSVASNTVVGNQAGVTNSTGVNNLYAGQYAGYYATGSSNIALGAQALSIASAGATGSSNIAIGVQALTSNTTASNNTAVGYQSGYNNTTGANNTLLGYQTGYALTTGSANIFIGQYAGYYFNGVTTGNNNICIGQYASTNAATDGNEIVIGNAVGKGSNTGYIYPNGGGTYQGNNSTLWSITSDARLKKNIVDNKVGLDKITAIQVRNFEYRTADEITELPKEQAIDIKGVQLGAIAQELQAVLPECVKTESTGVMSVDASNLTWYLINAVKELNAKITALENK